MVGATRIIPVGDEALGGSNSFGPIPTGLKLAMTVFDIEETVTGAQAKVPNKPQFIFTGKVTEDYAFDYVDPETHLTSKQNALGREIRYNYIPLFSEAGNAWALVAFAEAVGWPVTKNADGKPEVAVPVNRKEVLGTPFIGKVGQSQGADGKIYNRVNGYQKIGKGGGGKAAEAAPKKSWKDL